MKEKSFLILIITILFVINIFTLIHFFNHKQQIEVSEVIKYKQDKVKSEELNAYKVSFKTNLLNSNHQLGGMMIKDSMNNIIPLKESFDKGQKLMLICRFSKRHCESCVDSLIEILRKWVDVIGEDNVMFLGDYRNNRIFYRTIPLYGIQGMNVYNASSFNIHAEELGYPYCFVLDSNLQISNVFVPNKVLPKITNKYLEHIQKKFQFHAK